MVLKALSLFLILSLSRPVSANVLFEGYYKVLAGGNSIGYLIQKYELDPKTRVFTAAHYIKTNAVGGNLTESLVAKSNEKFQPISYQYTMSAGQTLKSIDAKFKGDKMTAVVSDGKTSNTLSVDLPKGAFMATFLGYLMLKEGYKKGKKFTYHAVAEEDAAVQTGEAFIEGNESYKSIDTFKIFNTFKNSKFISFVTHSGEVLATRSPIQNLATELVATPAEATAGHNVNEGHLKKIFGDVPKGKTHALAKAAAPTAAPTVTPAAPAQPDQPKPKGP